MVKEQAVNMDPKCWVTTIDNLISGYGAENQSENCELWIPSYQRGYAWEESNVKRLCKDLNNAIVNGNADYHLGTLIFHKDEINDGNGTRDIWAVVDGQQRLTTIGILLGEEAFIHRRDRQCVSSQNVDMINNILAVYGDRKQGILDFLRKCTVVCILVSDVSEAFQLFDTQNGRGKELSPVNLLKAYHFHEINRSSLYGNTLSDRRVRELESRWERSNAMTVLGGKRLLSQVFSEHLFRLRRWSRGNETSIPFTKKEMSEFQGLTLGCREDSLPLQNSAILRKLFREHYKSFGFSLDTVGGRLGTYRHDPEGMDPFMSICQAIVNGEDFFDYAETYSIIYRELFDVFEKKEGENKSVSLEDYELAEFRKFYKTYCLNYYGAWRVGDIYARHVFESLCIFCFDRFGCKGLSEFHQQLYRLTYFDRVINRSLFYQSAGSSYAIKLVPFMLTSETIAELSEAIQESIENMTNQCHNIIVNNEPLFKFDNNMNSNSSDISRWQFVLGMENLQN